MSHSHLLTLLDCNSRDCTSILLYFFPIPSHFGYPYLPSFSHPTHFPSHFLFLFSLPLSYAFSPPSIFPPSSLALSLSVSPHPPSVLSSILQNHPLPSLRLSVCACTGVSVRVCAWVTVCVSDHVSVHVLL